MDKHQLDDFTQVKHFIGAGRARFTLVSKKTGTRFTFRAKRKEGADIIFISVLTGSDNVEDYTFIGTMFPSRGYIPSRKSSISAAAPSQRAIRWFVEQMDKQAIPQEVEFWHEGRCGRCSRALTDPASIQRGFGPECINYV